MKKNTPTGAPVERIPVYLPGGFNWAARVKAAAAYMGRPRASFLREAVLRAVEEAESAAGCGLFYIPERAEKAQSLGIRIPEKVIRRKAAEWEAVRTPQAEAGE